MTFQLLEFSWKVSHFFHTLTIPLSTPTVPSKSDPHAGLLASLAPSHKLGKGNLSSCRGLDLAEIAAGAQGTVYRIQDEFEPHLPLGWRPWRTVAGSGSLCFLCAAHRPPISAVILGDDYPAESY